LDLYLQTSVQTRTFEEQRNRLENEGKGSGEVLNVQRRLSTKMELLDMTREERERGFSVDFDLS